MLYNGLEIIENSNLTKGYKQKKTHKSKRINKKWQKKYGYVSIPDKNVYVIDNKYIVGNPLVIKKIIEKIKKR